MGLLVGWLAFRAGAGWTQPARLFLATGFLGGFTTFSAFSLDAALLWERGRGRARRALRRGLRGPLARGAGRRHLARACPDLLSLALMARDDSKPAMKQGRSGRGGKGAPAGARGQPSARRRACGRLGRKPRAGQGGAGALPPRVQPGRTSIGPPSARRRLSPCRRRPKPRSPRSPAKDTAPPTGRKASAAETVAIGVQTLAVEPDEAGMRVDRFLVARFPRLAFTHIQRIVRKGELRVDKKRVGSERPARGRAERARAPL